MQAPKNEKALMDTLVGFSEKVKSITILPEKCSMETVLGKKMIDLSIYLSTLILFCHHVVDALSAKLHHQPLADVLGVLGKAMEARDAWESLDQREAVLDADQVESSLLDLNVNFQRALLQCKTILPKISELASATCLPEGGFGELPHKRMQEE